MIKTKLLNLFVATAFWAPYSGNINKGIIYNMVHEKEEQRVGVKSIPDSSGTYRPTPVRIFDDEDHIIRLFGLNSEKSKFELRDFYVTKSQYEKLRKGDCWEYNGHNAETGDTLVTTPLTKQEADSLIIKKQK